MADSDAQAARDRAYSPSLWARSFEASLARQARRGERLRERHPPRRLSYGPGAQQGINLFLPTTGKPRGLMVFLHGGYWQELDASATDFMAADWLEAGWAFASVDYPLAPQAPIEAIVEACRRAVAVLQRELGELNAEAPLHLGGHSAGAHLALASCLGDTGLVGIGSLWLISGIYDLRPLVETYINAPLGLDPERAEELSPLCQSLAGLPPLQLVLGEFDPPAFHRQSERLDERVRAAGGRCRLTELKDCDHFDILERLGSTPDRSGKDASANEST
ncbi:alpha/beta hydrolase [Halomonas salina]|uniref:alpha/beta hydrolase n=1 Tax=Halomonas salina TaxID=42565 RepID=UPI00068E0CE8|nr:alpha/beta hydrolase [Halomonas salina]